MPTLDGYDKELLERICLAVEAIRDRPPEVPTAVSQGPDSIHIGGLVVSISAIDNTIREVLAGKTATLTPNDTGSITVTIRD